MTISRADGTGAVVKTVPRPTNGDTRTAATLTGLPHGVELPVAVRAFPTADGTGVAYALGAGTVTVGEDTPGAVAVAMDSTVTSLAIAPRPLNVAPGGETTLTASARERAGNIVLLAANDRNETLTWTCDDPALDTVTGSGPQPSSRTSARALRASPPPSSPPTAARPSRRRPRRSTSSRAS